MRHCRCQRFIAVLRVGGLVREEKSSEVSKDVTFVTRSHQKLGELVGAVGFVCFMIFHTFALGYLKNKMIKIA